MLTLPKANHAKTTMVDDDLVPMPTWRILITFFYLLGTTSVKRVLGFTPPVVGWTIMQEFAVKFIRQTFLTPTEDLRRNQTVMTSLVNVMLPVSLVPVVEKDFCGLWYGATAAADADATILYLHGGGFSTCTASTNAEGVTSIQTALAKMGKSVRVLALEFSLAPEAKFPTQVNQALAAYEYLVYESSKPVILLGDSAGGNLVLSLLLTLQPKEGAPTKVSLRSPTAVVLISPLVQLNLELIAASFTTNRDADFIPLSFVRANVRDYIGDTATSATDPRVSPIYGNFRGCPAPVYIHYGGKEVFRDDIEAMVNTLTDQGLRVTTMMEPLGVHISPLLPTFFGDMATAGIQGIASYLATVLA
ncbi:Aste57867_8316 [Aphanomyces stellatus]|uniref:Aste57867_8316 protein n=1 Tax=Aphanomyces stellatus TaxID=120398 RepID=A0A485KJW4_9STRA|nr:hypothetical protein As57867_008284 [Aphanomyces stellatus]VFT85203.1 Aste57867_8316 [Aphanomyces stellatus]